MNKQIVFSALMIPACLFIAANRFTIGQEYWGAFWLFCAFAHGMAIREQLKLRKAFSSTAWRDGKEWGAWFRVFGYGICLSTSPLLFSERNGYTKVWRVFGVKIKLLKRG